VIAGTAETQVGDIRVVTSKKEGLERYIRVLIDHPLSLSSQHFYPIHYYNTTIFITLNHLLLPSNKQPTQQPSQ